MINVKYDAPFNLSHCRNGKYSQEISILFDFSNITYNNVRLEYATPQEARIAVSALNHQIRVSNLNVRTAQRGNAIYLVHKEVK